jgi:hypothetical protein
MPARSTPASPDHGFLDLVHAIVSGDAAKALRLSDSSLLLVKQRAAVGASRDNSE